MTTRACRTLPRRYLHEIAARDAPSFICHFYNVYFAHTAGGRMIGKKVSDMILGGKTLDFYCWDGDLNAHMTAVKGSLNSVAEARARAARARPLPADIADIADIAYPWYPRRQGWTAEERERCLKETELSFKYSGQLLRYVAA